MIEKKAALTNSFWSIADNFAQQAISFLIFTLLARWLSPHAFGLLAIAHIGVQFVRFAILDPLALPVLRSQQIEPRLYSWLFTQCTCVAIVVALLMATSAPALARFFEAEELVSVLWGMSFAVVLLGVGRAHDALLLRQGKFRLIAMRSLLSVTTGGAVAIVLAYRGYGAMALVAQQIITTGMAFLISVFAEWSFWRPRWHFSLPLTRQHGPESAKASITGMLTYANGNGDALLVSVLLGPHATGLYNLAKRVTSAISLMIASSIGRVASSMFYRTANEPEKLGAHYAHMTGLMLSGLMLIYGLVANLAEPIVRIVFGAQWQPATPLLAILSISGLFQGLFNIGQSASLTTRRGTRTVRLGVLQLALAVALAVALSSEGLSGMAIGFAIATVISACTMHKLVTAQIKLPWRRTVREVTPAAFGLLVLSIVIHIVAGQIEIQSWLWLGIVACIGAGAYVIVFAPLFFWLNRSP